MSLHQLSLHHRPHRQTARKARGLKPIFGSAPIPAPIPVLKPVLGIAVGVALATLSGCADVPRTVSHVQSQNDVFDLVITPTLPLEVYGNPFPGVSDQTVADASAAGMSGQVNARPLTFVVVPPGQATGPYRTVLYLSSGGVVSGAGLCTGPLPRTDAGGDRIHASAALCQGPTLVAWAEGWLGRQTSPEQAPYQSLMDQLANAVFTRLRDHDHGGDAWPR